MQSIETKYVGAGYASSSRIKATASGCKHSVTVSYRVDLTTEQNHDRAAMLLAKKLNWYQGIEAQFRLVRGGSQAKKGRVFGFVYVIFSLGEVVTLADVNTAAKSHGIEEI